MPMVRSYFRRSPGQAGEVDTSSTRTPDVAIYDASTGADLLKWRGGGRMQISGVSFSTGLPGGFLDCSFTLSGSPGRMWKVDTGQKVIVRWGNKIVWWGWIEDVSRMVQGNIQSLRITCLGPWQNCQQRYIEAYGPNDLTNQVVKAALLGYCERISTNYAHIDATGVTANGDIQEFVFVADVIKSICELGNSANQPMLFAIWEPNLHRPEVLLPTNLANNPGFEVGTGNEASGWQYDIGALGSPYTGPSERRTEVVRSGSWGGGGGPLGFPDEIEWRTPEQAHNYSHGNITLFAVTPGQSYMLRVFHRLEPEVPGSYYSWWNALGLFGVDWHDAGDVKIGGELWIGGIDYLYSTTNWRQEIRYVVAPIGAVKARIRFGAGGNHWPNNPPETHFFGAIDDVAFYGENEVGTEAKPIAYFWPRDLSDFDYYIYTAATAGVGLNESTRALANNIIAQYEDGYTEQAQDATSQAAYRQRDAVIDAGASTATIAAQIRDVYLARYKDPLTDVAGSINAAWGVILSKHGRPVQPLFIRAGDRLKVMDGPKAGTILLLDKTSYSNGVVTLSPESGAVIAEILAKGI